MFHVVARPSESGTRAFFDERVLTGAALDPSAIVIEHNDDIVHYVASDPAAIAYVAAGFVTADVRVVPLLDDARVPRSPEADTIREGAYPLARPLIVYVREPTTSVTLAFLEWLVGDAGRERLSQHGFVPVELGSDLLADVRADDDAPRRVPLRLGLVGEASVLDDATRASVANWLGTHDASHYVVEGHAAADEHEPEVLSQRRADAVRDVLIDAGVDRAEVTAVGLGASRPIGPLGSTTRRRLAARVEVFAVADSPVSGAVKQVRFMSNL